MSKEIQILLDMKEPLKEFADTAELLFRKGWAERNAGNISYNVTDLLKDFHPETFVHEIIPFEHGFKNLTGKMFLISSTNSRMRDLAKAPEDYVSLIKILSVHELITYNLSEKTSDRKPTSELATHLAIHNLILENNFPEKAVLHTHPNELIALSHIKEFQNSVSLTELLWSMHPETIIFLPRGVGFVPYTITGSVELAKKSTEVLKNFKIALWEKHGCIAIGEKPTDAYDLIDTLAKSANIYFTCKSAGFQPEGLTGEQLSELKKKFGN